MDIKGKVIIVTGASMGIGEAAARLLAQGGATVVLAARSKEKLDTLSAELLDSSVIPTDMTNPEDIKHLMEETVALHGRIDVLVNNAGQGLYSPIEHIDIDDYKKIIELNVMGPLRAMQAVIPIMRSQGGGSIVNISSMLSRMYIPNLGAYASTKYTLNALSLTARAELEKDNIVISIMLPGLTATEFGKNSIVSDPQMRTRIGSRPGMPEPDSAEYIASRIKETIESGGAEVLAH